MKRIDLSKQKLNPNFIGSWTMNPLLCENIIDYFEENIQRQVQGVTSGGVKLNVKDRKDITLNPKDISLPENEVFKLKK